MDRINNELLNCAYCVPLKESHQKQCPLYGYVKCTVPGHQVLYKRGETLCTECHPGSSGKDRRNEV